MQNVWLNLWLFGVPTIGSASTLIIYSSTAPEPSYAIGSVIVALVIWAILLMTARKVKSQFGQKALPTRKALVIFVLFVAALGFLLILFEFQLRRMLGLGPMLGFLSAFPLYSPLFG